MLERSFLANADLFAWGMFAVLAIGMLRQHDKMPRLAWGTKALSLVVIVAVLFIARHNESRSAISLVGICAAAPDSCLRRCQLTTVNG